jgi:hypothetical protein
MASITFSKFDLGIDLRKGASVSDANRLREMKNARVTAGLATEKRPGITKVATLEPGTAGLVGALGKLNTFYSQTGTITHANPLFMANKAGYATGTTTVERVEYADVFNGVIYAALKHSDGQTKHHYMDGTVSTVISDANCPHTAAVLKLASKMFAVSPDGSTVRYCKTGDPRDWTTANDAGFLPTGINARGDRATNALGVYQNKLVALARDGSQVWTVDPDPTNMKLDDIVENVGSSFPLSLATVGGDLFFLSDYGFRSITTQAIISKLTDVDIGSPIDTLVRADLATGAPRPMAAYFYGTGQYLCLLGQTMYVYSVSRTAKIAAWSRYALPFAVDAMAELQGTLYFRTGDDVYKLTPDVYTDDGAEYEVLIQLPYMDFKSPGQMKQIYGIDLVMEGECYFSMGFDVRNAAAVTSEVRVVGNTRGGGMVPFEVCGTEFSPQFRNQNDQPFRLDALTVYYNNLGPM